MSEKVNAGHPGRRSFKKYLINPRFQLSFLSYFLFFTVLTIFLIFIFSRMAWNSLLEHSLAAQIPANPITQEFLNDQKQLLGWIFLFGSIEAIVVLIIGGLIISHRIAGPIHQVRKELENIAAGGYPQFVKFRTHDYFDEVQEIYNKAIQRLIEHGIPLPKDKNVGAKEN